MEVAAEKCSWMNQRKLLLQCLTLSASQKAWLLCRQNRLWSNQCTCFDVVCLPASENTADCHHSTGSMEELVSYYLNYLLLFSRSDLVNRGHCAVSEWSMCVITCIEWIYVYVIRWCKYMCMCIQKFAVYSTVATIQMCWAVMFINQKTLSHTFTC